MPIVALQAFVLQNAECNERPTMVAQRVSTVLIEIALMTLNYTPNDHHSGASKKFEVRLREFNKDVNSD